MYNRLLEVLVGTLFAWCLVDGIRSGATRTARLLAAFAYGLVLEVVTQYVFHRYTYLPSRFVAEVAGVPLVIAAGWAIILYAAQRATDGLAAGPLQKALMEAALALSIDLPMDPVAAHLGYWRWTPPGPWWGVPVGNFYGWAAVVVCFSLLSRRLADRGPGWMAPVLAAALSLPLLQLVLQVGDWLPSSLVVAVTAAVFLMGLQAGARRGFRLKGLSAAIPVTLVAFYLGAYVLSGHAALAPALLAVFALCTGLQLWWMRRAVTS